MKLAKTLSTAGFLCLAAFAHAEDTQTEKGIFGKERFMIRGRIINVVPSESSSTSLNGTIDADNDTVPEIDFTYFMTDHIAAELILATSQHKMDHENPGLDLGDVKILPPTLTLQYHFTPDAKFRPYVGAGLNYTIFYDEDPSPQTFVEYENNIGYALQAGFDVALDDHWGINFDLKKIYLETDAKVNGSVTADVALDPWIGGIGLSYRF